MPNHFHAIVIIREYDGDFAGAHGRNEPTALNGIVGAHGRNEPTALNGIVGAQRAAPLRNHPIRTLFPFSIGSIIRAYKSAVTTRINQIHGMPAMLVW